MLIKIKIYCKNAALKLAIIAGINTIFSHFNRKKIVILYYHGVCQDSFTLSRDFDGRHIPVSVFEKQLAYLKNSGYKFLNMTDVADILTNGKQISDRLVCLTFDDGFENVVKNAYPLMVKYGARGCFYVISGLIGTKDLLWTNLVGVVLRMNNKTHFTFEFDKDINYDTTSRKETVTAIEDIKKKLKSVSNERRLELLKQFQRVHLEDVPREFSLANWDQLRNLDPHILEIGSHTMTHPDLDKLNSENEFRREISYSKDLIEEKLKRNIRHFCYPSGSYNAKVIKEVQHSGYISAVTVNPGFNDENTGLYELKRINVDEDFSLFKSTISGSYLAIVRIYKSLSE